MFERKILRNIFGPTKEDNGNWRIETNIELDELIKHRNIINYVKAQRLSWFGHISRMPETSIVKKIHKWKPFTGRRCQERPEEDETHKMDRTSPRSPQMERNCWEGQDCSRVVVPSKRKKSFWSLVQWLVTIQHCLSNGILQEFVKCVMEICHPQCDSWGLKLSWHSQLLNGINSNSHLEGGGQAFELCACTSCAVEA